MDDLPAHNLPIELVPQVALALWALVRVWGEATRGARRPFREQLDRIHGYALFGLVLAFVPVSLGDAVHPLPAPAAGHLLLLFAAWVATQTRLEEQPLLARWYLFPLAFAGASDAAAWFGVGEPWWLETYASFARALVAFGACDGLRRVFEASAWPHHALLARALPYVLVAGLLGGLTLEYVGFSLPRKLSRLPLTFGYAAKAATLVLSAGPPLAFFFLTWRLRGELAGEIYAERVRVALDGVPIKDRSARLQALTEVEAAARDEPDPGSAPGWRARAVWLWTAACLLGCCLSSALVNAAQLGARPGGYRVVAVPRDLALARGEVDDRELFRALTGVFLHTAPQRSEWLATQPARDVVVALWEDERLVLCGRFTTPESGGLRWEPSSDLPALREASGLEVNRVLVLMDRLDVSFPPRSWVDDLLEFGEGPRPVFQRMMPGLSAADGLLLVEGGGGVGAVHVWRSAGRIRAEARLYDDASAAMRAWPISGGPQSR